MFSDLALCMLSGKLSVSAVCFLKSNQLWVIQVKAAVGDKKLCCALSEGSLVKLMHDFSHL